MPEPTAVLIPALNEEPAIARVIAEIPRARCHRIIVIDNGSRDRTAEAARGAGAEVVQEPRRGYGHACRAGLACLGPETEVVAFLDADHSDYPAELTALTAPIYEGRADFVLGSRTLRPENEPFLAAHQRWGNRLAVGLIRMLHGHAFTDLGPFRAIRRAALDALALRDTTWGWNVEMQIEALRAGLRIVEVPVRYRERIGRSKISGTVRGSVNAGARILFTVARLTILRYHGSGLTSRP